MNGPESSFHRYNYEQQKQKQWSDMVPALNESVYLVPVIYDDYGMFFSTNETIPLSLMVGFHNLVFYGEFRSDVDNLEIDIMEDDISPFETPIQFERSNGSNKMYLPMLNMSAPGWDKRHLDVIPA